MVAYTSFIAGSILVFCMAGFIVVMGWSLPRAIHTYRLYSNGSPAALYAKWQLLRTVLYAAQLFFFIAPVAGYFILPDYDELRRTISFTALLIVALCIAITALSEPVAQRHVESALARERKKASILKSQASILKSLDAAAIEVEDRYSERELEKSEVRERIDKAEWVHRHELEEAFGAVDVKLDRILGLLERKR